MITALISIGLISMVPINHAAIYFKYGRALLKTLHALPLILLRFVIRLTHRALKHHNQLTAPLL